MPRSICTNSSTSLKRSELLFGRQEGLTGQFDMIGEKGGLQQVEG